MGTKLTKNKKRNRNNVNSNNNSFSNSNNIVNYNNNNNNNNNNNINNNIDLTNIDNLIDNNLIDNLINSDLNSSYTDDYMDYYDVVIDLDFRDSNITTANNLVMSNRNNNLYNHNQYHNHHYNGNNSNNINNNNSCCNNSGNINSSLKEDWKCSSIFVTYNLKITTGDCPKEVITDVQKRISTFKKSMKTDQLDLYSKEFLFNNDIDLISTILSKEIQYNIISYLSIYDILSLFQVNKYWYELGLNNHFWKGLLYRDMEKWNNREAIKFTINNYESQSLHFDISWKRYYSNVYRLRLCKKCGIVYRESSNYITACCYHADIRDIVHSRGVPSGVYWICCLSKPKQAPGCTMSCHEEENQYDYPPLMKY